MTTKVTRNMLDTSIVDNGNATALTIDTNENIGLAARLSVGTTTVGGGNTKIVTTGGTDNYIQLVSNTGTGGVSLGNAGSVFLLYTHTGALGSESFSERMRIDSSGNVGIGTSSPNAYTNYTVLTIDSPSSGTGSVIDLEYRTDRSLSMFSEGELSTIREIRNYPLAFGTNNTERMRIDASGNVGINTSSPAGKLHITNTGGGTTPSNYMRVEGATANNSNYPAIEVKGGTLANVYPSYGMTNGGLGTWITAGYHTSNYNVRAAWSVNNGSLGGYTSSGTSYTQTFLVAQNGDTSTNDGTISSLSDERVKTDIKDLTDGLEIVKKLRPVTFKYNDDSTDDDGNLLMASTSDKTRFGFIAQEVEKVAPQYVETITRKIKNVEVDDFKTLSATRMIPMLFKAIQEQQTQIEALQSEVNTLKGG